MELLELMVLNSDAVVVTHCYAAAVVGVIVVGVDGLAAEERLGQEMVLVVAL